MNKRVLVQPMFAKSKMGHLSPRQQRWNRWIEGTRGAGCCVQDLKITSLLKTTLFMRREGAHTLVNKVESSGRRAALGGESQHDLVWSGQRQSLACNTEWCQIITFNSLRVARGSKCPVINRSESLYKMELLYKMDGLITKLSLLDMLKGSAEGERCGEVELAHL